MYEDVVTVLTGHTTEDTAFVQDDYPYGRSLRCKRRVWVETASKGAKKGQQRFMAQTTNPRKTIEHWNKPKGSTYSDVIVIYLNGDDHVKTAHLGLYSKREDVAAFVEMFGEHLTDAQWSAIKVICAYHKVNDRIKWKVCEPGEKGQTPQQQAKIISAMVAQELRNPTPV